jgi:hypothetical protein
VVSNHLPASNLPLRIKLLRPGGDRIAFSAGW